MPKKCGKGCCKEEKESKKKKGSKKKNPMSVPDGCSCTVNAGAAK